MARKQYPPLIPAPPFLVYAWGECGRWRWEGGDEKGDGGGGGEKGMVTRRGLGMRIERRSISGDLALTYCDTAHDGFLCDLTEFRKALRLQLEVLLIGPRVLILIC